MVNGENEQAIDALMQDPYLASAAPTALVIIGTRDVADSQKNADLLKTQVPNCQRVDIEGSGHLVNLEKPKEFDAAVERRQRTAARGRK